MQLPANKILAESTVKIQVFTVTIGNNTVVIAAVNTE
jgi:hypothetical protein